MIHEKYVMVPGDGTKAHIFEYKKGIKWASNMSACGMIKDFISYALFFKIEPGDGRPTCRVCAKIAKERGWLG